MPRCYNCGNTSSFNNSKIKDVPQFSESLGFAGFFSDEGELKHIENRNAPQEVSQAAWTNPEMHFDTCSLCGGQNIIWP